MRLTTWIAQKVGTVAIGSKFVTLGVATSFALLLAPGVAAAQSEEEMFEYVPPPRSERMRLRAGVASGAALGGSNQPKVAGGAGASIELALGAQISRRLGIYALGTAATLLLSWDVSAYGIVEYNLAPWFSIGTGFGYDAALTFNIMCMENCSTSWRGFTVPLVMGFEILATDEWHSYDRRAPLRLQFVAAPGVDSINGAFGGHLATSFGVAWK